MNIQLLDAEKLKKFLSDPKSFGDWHPSARRTARMVMSFIRRGIEQGRYDAKLDVELREKTSHICPLCNSDVA